MLPFYYTFLILVLSSSVIAKRKLRSYGHAEFLIHNKDESISKGLWSLVEISESAPVTDATTEARQSPQHLDHAIRFGGGTLGVENVIRLKIKRKLMVNRAKMFENGRNSGTMDLTPGTDTYRVVRTRYGDSDGNDNRPAETEAVDEPILIEDSAQFLNNTYWARNPKILGEVSDSLMIWKHLLHALSCHLQKRNSPNRDLGTVIHIQWRTCTICNIPRRHKLGKGLQDPYVTFLSAEGIGWQNILMAEEFYKVVNGVQWTEPLVSGVEH